MGDSKKWTRRAAVGSLVSGGGLLLFGTGGSTQISTYRDVEVNAGGDDAVLQFSDNSSDTTIGLNSSVSVYQITDNAEAFDSNDINVTASIDGTEEPIDASIIGDGNPFDVKVECSDETSRLVGKRTIKLEFTAVSKTENFIISASRDTSSVEFDCYDYGATNNYRDRDKGNANLPNDPVGTISQPKNVNRGVGGFAEISSGPSVKSKVGYALPPVSFDGPYELLVEVGERKGRWSAYLVAPGADGESNKLTSTQGNNGMLGKNGTTIIEFDTSADIKKYKDELYLIFEATDSSNQSIQIDYFELRAQSQ